MERLYPDPGPAALEEQLDLLDHAARAPAERPLLHVNFAATVDGRATIEGRSGQIGSDRDTELLMGLRERADAVLVGAGTIRAENYGRLLPSEPRRRRRQQRGLPPDPLAVIVSNRLALPWTAGLFTSGAGEVVVFTSSTNEVPETATPVEVVRHPDGVDLGEAFRRLRDERAVSSLLSEGGPRLHGDLLSAGLVDELFLTIGPALAGGEGPRIVEGLAAGPLELELLWLLREDSELFARYAVADGG